MRDSLAAIEPELLAGDYVLRECTPELLRLKKEVWTVLYRATLSRSCAAGRDLWLAGWLYPPHRTLPGRDAPAAAFGSDNWRGVLPDLRLELHTEVSDEALPSLSGLTDPHRARVLLEGAIRACPAYSDLGIAACKPRVIRDARGSRCTVLYEVDYQREATVPPWPSVVAKTYRADKGQNAYAAMRKLWDSPLRRSPLVTLAEPVAYLPDVRVLVQGGIPGDLTLKELIRLTLDRGTHEALHELDRYMARTAEGLAALHGCGVYHGETATFEDELIGVRNLVGRLADPIPELADAATPLLDRVAGLAARYPADPSRPAHRSFRPAQVLLDDGGVGFVDFDGYCQAEPALDIAQFRASVRDVGIGPAGTEGTSPPSPSTTKAVLTVLDEVCERFLSRYEDILSVSRERVMLWETLDLLTSVLHAWTKVQPALLPGRMLMLERHLRAAGLWS